MSIYSELLNAALEQTQKDEDEPTIGEAWANLLECRGRLGADISLDTQPGWATAAVADQLAYDIALIRLARRLEADIDLNGFGQGLDERTRLERALETRLNLLI